MALFAGFVAGQKPGATAKTATAPARSSDQSIDAALFCKYYIEALGVLRAPATAKFESLNTQSVTRVGTTYTVRSWVDAQNGFGAMIRTPFMCVATSDGAKDWHIGSLTGLVPDQVAAPPTTVVVDRDRSREAVLFCHGYADAAETLHAKGFIFPAVGEPSVTRGGNGYTVHSWFFKPATGLRTALTCVERRAILPK